MSSSETKTKRIWTGLANLAAICVIASVVSREFLTRENVKETTAVESHLTGLRTTSMEGYNQISIEKTETQSTNIDPSRKDKTKANVISASLLYPKTVQRSERNLAKSGKGKSSSLFDPCVSLDTVSKSSKGKRMMMNKKKRSVMSQKENMSMMKKKKARELILELGSTEQIFYEPPRYLKMDSSNASKSGSKNPMMKKKKSKKKTADDEDLFMASKSAGKSKGMSGKTGKSGKTASVPVSAQAILASDAIFFECLTFDTDIVLL